MKEKDTNTNMGIGTLLSKYPDQKLFYYENVAVNVTSHYLPHTTYYIS